MYKITLLFFIFSISNLYSFCQTRKIQKSVKLLSNGNYELSLEKILEFRSKNPSSPLSFFCHHLWYIEKTNAAYNPDSAYYYLNKAIILHATVTEKESKDICIDFGFCKEMFDNYKENDAILAFEIIRNNNLVDKIDSFLKFYSGLNISKTAINYRDSVYFKKALDKNNSLNIVEYIQKYPDSKYIKEANEKLYLIAFKEAETKNTEASYLYYINKYPKSPLISNARNEAISINYSFAQKINTEQAYLEHIQKYPESIYKESCIKNAEELGFKELTLNSGIKQYKEFIERYSNSKYVVLVNNRIKELERNELLYYVDEYFFKENFEKMKYFFKVNDIQTIFDLYISIKEFNRYFKDDTSALMDQLQKIKAGWGNSGGFMDYTDHYLEVDKNIKTKPKFSSYGFSFYDKIESKFMRRSSANDRKGYSGYQFFGDYIIFNEGKQVNIEPLGSIVSTPISYIFVLANKQHKICLFNTKINKIITEWVDNVEFIFIYDWYFLPKSHAGKLLNLNPLFIGFKINNGTSCSIVNGNGKEIVDAKLFTNPFGGDNLGILYSTCNDHNNSQYGSGYVRFTSAKSKVSGIGVCNTTFDSIILAPIYSNIYDLDEFNNLIVQDKYYKIFNIINKTFMSIPSNAAHVHRTFLPFGRSGVNENWFSYYENPYNEFPEGRMKCSFCYRRNDTHYDSSNYSLVYCIQTRNKSNYSTGLWIYNYKGKEIYNSTNPETGLLAASDSILLIRVKYNKNILIDINGKLIWDPGKDYLMQFLSDELIVYGYKSKEGLKNIGLYHINKGVIFEPIFENITIENNALYGLKMGEKKLMWEK
jgi:hypothetical protein